MARQTGLQLTFSTQRYPTEFVLVDMTWDESLLAPFFATLKLASTDKAIEPDNLLDTKGQVKLFKEGQLVRTWSGNIFAFEQGNLGVSRRFYQVRLGPDYARLKLYQNSRIFQQQSVPEIIEQLLKDRQINNYALSLKQSYPKREYCVQYNETDFDFIQRLIAEVGIYYYFEQTHEDHTLVFVDHFAPPKIEQPTPYNARSGSVAKKPFITSFSYQKTLRATEVTLNDYHFKNPVASLVTEAKISELPGQAQRPYEHYHYRGRYKDTEIGQEFAKVRLQALRADAEVVHGQSNQPDFVAGLAFEMTDHPSEAANRYWLLTGVRHTATQAQALEEESGDGMTLYKNSFSLVPDTTPFKLPPLPKPQVLGPLLATVVGPEGESIYCDQYGRVKIKFPWDRYADGRENSSCWIRVAQPWAGNEYGFTRLPRIGHEVLICFTDGDPDQPMILSEGYNADNKPPYELPANKTKSVWRSRTHQGEGYNEISFEDQAGREEVFIHAQKDLKEQINNDRMTDIDHQEHLNVLDDQFHKIQSSQNLSVEKQHRTAIAGNMSQTTQGMAQYQSGQKSLINAKQGLHVKAAQRVLINAGTQVELNAGGSKIDITPSSINGLSPSLVYGGAGSTSALAFAGGIPDLPGQVTPPAPPAPMVLPQYGQVAKRFATAEPKKDAEHLCQQQSDGSCPLTDCPCGNHQGV